MVAVVVVVVVAVAVVVVVAVGVGVGVVVAVVVGVMTKLQQAVLDAAKVEYMKCTHDVSMEWPFSACDEMEDPDFDVPASDRHKCIHYEVCKAVHALLMSDEKSEVVEVKAKLDDYEHYEHYRWYYDDEERAAWWPEPDTWYRIEKMEDK